MSEIVIASAARTPVGTFNGALAACRPTISARSRSRRRSSARGVEPGEVSEVVMGQILTAGQGQNPARQASIEAGVPVEVPAWGVNQLCGSGLRAVALGFQAIRQGDSQIVVAGGQESMSQAPHCAHLRDGTKMGDLKMVDTMIKDGLWDAFHGYHMGTPPRTSPRSTRSPASSRTRSRSPRRTRPRRRSRPAGFKDEIVPVTIKTRKGDVVVDTDEYPRFGTTLETVAKLRPAFAKEGSVTAGNASGINDGAAAVVLMSDRGGHAARHHAARPDRVLGARRRRSLDHGHRPDPGLAQGARARRLVADDLDLVEANEAFAAQACAVNKDLGWDTDKVNVNGGAIALGHPIGASGTRVFVTLLHEMIKRDAKKGLATLCIGGGMGIAMCVARD